MVIQLVILHYLLQVVNFDNILMLVDQFPHFLNHNLMNTRNPNVIIKHFQYI
jgi:hypothetical protein